MRGARRASPPSLLDQIEARGAEKVFWETAPPPLPYLRVWMTAPFLLSAYIIICFV